MRERREEQLPRERREPAEETERREPADATAFMREARCSRAVGELPWRWREPTAPPPRPSRLLEGEERASTPSMWLLLGEELLRRMSLYTPGFVM